MHVLIASCFLLLEAGTALGVLEHQGLLSLALMNTHSIVAVGCLHTGEKINCPDVAKRLPTPKAISGATF